MTPEQKISVIALGVFAASAITLGLLHVQKGIVASVAWKSSAKNIEETEDVGKKDDISELQGKDTDNDGLNDFEELQVFSTSPYLQDTDGDNASDTKEIQAGTDPNCPEGKKCGAESAADKTIAEENKKNPLLVPELETAVGLPDQEEFKKMQSLLSGQDITPAQVRELLKQSGVGEDVLSKVDDAVLMQIYGQVLEQFKTQSSTEAAETQAPLVPNPEE